MPAGVIDGAVNGLDGSAAVFDCGLRPADGSNENPPFFFGSAAGTETIDVALSTVVVAGVAIAGVGLRPNENVAGSADVVAVVVADVVIDAASGSDVFGAFDETNTATFGWIGSSSPFFVVSIAASVD